MDALAYEFIYRRTCWLFIGLEIMNSDYKHSCSDFCVDVGFQFIWINTEECDFPVIWWICLVL